MSDLNNPQRWACGNCGHSFYDDDGWSEWYCSQCGEKIHKSTPEGYVPENELRALVEEWRETAKSYGINPGDTEDIAAERAYDNCAVELEELIEDD